MSLIEEVLGNDGSDILYEVMALVMLIDGEIHESELEKLGALVASRPEFGELQIETILDRLRRAVDRTTKSFTKETFDEQVEKIANKLPDHKARLLAFGVATTLAMADGDLHENEKDLLTIFSRAFSLSDVEVKEIANCVKSGQPLEALFPLPENEQLRAYVEAMTLVMGADGQISREEVRSMTEEIIRCSALEALTFEKGALYLQKTLDALEKDGLEARLSSLGRTLSSPKERFTAFLLAIKMAKADGELTRDERHLLARLEAIFALPPEEVKRAYDEAESDE